MKKILFILLLILSSFDCSEANDIDNKFFDKIKFIIAEDHRIAVTVDLDKSVINLDKIEIKHYIPLGTLKLDRKGKSISVPITKREVGVIEDEEVIITGSDRSEGIGTLIEISFFIEGKTSTIKIESQFEEIKLIYIPQLVPFKIIKGSNNVKRDVQKAPG